MKVCQKIVGELPDLSMGQALCTILDLKRCPDCQIMTEQMNSEHLSSGISVESPCGCCLCQGTRKGKSYLRQERVSETRKGGKFQMSKIVLRHLGSGSCKQIRVQVHLQRLDRFGGKFVPGDFIGDGARGNQEQVTWTSMHFLLQTICISALQGQRSLFDQYQMNVGDRGNPRSPILERQRVGAYRYIFPPRFST